MAGNLSRSRLGQTERQLAEVDRAVRLSRVTPSPPRQVLGVGTILSWLPPPPTSKGVFDYYRIYAPGDGNDKLVRQVPADQLFLSDGLSGTSIFVSAYNSTTGSESTRVPMVGSLSVGVITTLTNQVDIRTLSSIGSTTYTWPPPPFDGDFLTVDIRIPAGAAPGDEYEILWGGGFDPDTPVTLNDAPGARNLFFFTGIAGGTGLIWTLLSYRGYVPA